VAPAAAESTWSNHLQQTTSELGCFRRHRAQVVTVNTKHLLIAAAGSGWPACARVRSLSMNNFVGNESRKWTAPGNPKYALNKKTPDIKVPADSENGRGTFLLCRGHS